MVQLKFKAKLLWKQFVIAKSADWSASPVNGVALWQPEDVKIIKGKELLKSYPAVVGHDKKWCTTCGGLLLTDHSESFGVIDVCACILEDYEFEPSFHINYECRAWLASDGPINVILRQAG